MTNYFTGKNLSLLTSLTADIDQASEIKLIVAFIKQSGARLIAESLQMAIQRGCKVTIITGTYMNVTEPSALYTLKSILGPECEIKLYSDTSISFHPKAYMMYNENEIACYIGSSNLSSSALTTGVEWNYKLSTSSGDQDDIKGFEDAFNHIYRYESVLLTDTLLRYYSQQWQTQKQSTKFIIDTNNYPLPENVDALKQMAENTFSDSFIYGQNEILYQPNDVQTEALYEIEIARKEGVQKGLVVAATGIGKTFLAAFDVQNFQAERVLFVAHREEILKQAQITFGKVLKNKSTGILNGNEKNYTADIVFASVNTLSKDIYLSPNFFAHDAFDYIIIDEFHHAASPMYLKIMNYFKSKFMMGLTATPYRMDNQDLFKLCDYNILYEIDIQRAISYDVLVPFIYKGIYDPTDYSKVTRSGNQYAISSLQKSYENPQRMAMIFDAYRSYNDNLNDIKSKTVGFCVSINHAEQMVTYFNAQNRKHNYNIRSATLHSGNQHYQATSDRETLINDFREGRIDLLFTVDIFNEGVDIPQIDAVMFLRATESYTVFMQQLGRGLRKFPGKEHLKVFDFIGNYKNANFKPLLLAGINPQSKLTGETVDIDSLTFPPDCYINFDMKIIDLFRIMSKSNRYKDKIDDEFFRLKILYGRVPTRLEIYEGSDICYRNFFSSGKSYKTYIDLLMAQSHSDLLPEFLDDLTLSFLQKIEKTSMSRSYKLPVLSAIYHHEGSVNFKALGTYYKAYYLDNPQYGNDLKDKKHKDWRTWTADNFLKEAMSNPVKFLNKTHNEHFTLTDDRFSLNEDLFKIKGIFSQEKKDYVLSQLGDIIDLKEKLYFSRLYGGQND